MPGISKSQLLKLQKRLKTDQSIARLYGLTRQAVQQSRKKFGIPPAVKRQEDRNQHIRTMYANGVTAPRLSRRFSLSLAQIYRIVRGARGLQSSHGADKNKPAIPRSAL